MITSIRYNEGNLQLDLPDDENLFYQKIGKIISELTIPNTIEVKTENGTASYQITKRSASMFIVENHNSILTEEDAEYPKCYLTCINEKQNNYKFYQLEDTGCSILATYGRIGSGPNEMFGVRTYSYPKRMYWMKYYEKLSKGYKDKTEIFVERQEDKPEPKGNLGQSIENTISVQLYERLYEYARHLVSSSLTSNIITKAMCKESKRIIKKLCTLKTVENFNKYLIELLVISPRRTRYVDSLLAQDVSDFAKIIEREENLADAMSVMVGNVQKTATINKFIDYEIDIFEATKEQKDEVSARLSDSLKGRVKRVYRVIPKKQKEKFDQYVKKNKITNIKQYWHGSRNENWLSIIQNGLSLKPNAVITGKMFGNGIYFAPSSLKSWNYTSCSGSYWARGNANEGFMGLYATAYGKPVETDCAKRFTKQDLGGKNCVHAKAGSCLRNDEIIFYDEASVLLNYIVEFS